MDCTVQHNGPNSRPWRPSVLLFELKSYTRRSPNLVGALRMQLRARPVEELIPTFRVFNDPGLSALVFPTAPSACSGKDICRNSLFQRPVFVVSLSARGASSAHNKYSCSSHQLAADRSSWTKLSSLHGFLIVTIIPIPFPLVFHT